MPSCELTIKWGRWLLVLYLSFQADNVLFIIINIAWSSTDAAVTSSGRCILLLQLGNPDHQETLGLLILLFFFFFFICNDHQLLCNNSSPVICVSLPEASQKQFCYEVVLTQKARVWVMHAVWGVQAEIGPDGIVMSVQHAKHCCLYSKSKLFSKEGSNICASHVALVVLCSGIANTKATGIRAACNNEVVLTRCLSCSSNAQQATLLPLLTENTNTLREVSRLGRNHCWLFLEPREVHTLWTNRS